MSEKISFRELVRHISARADKSQQFTQEFVTELTKRMESGLNSSGSVTIAGFGKFELRWMNERKGIHPQTGREITIPAQNKVIFKPYKPLREYVNRPYANLKPQILNDSPENSENKVRLSGIPPIDMPEVDKTGEDKPDGNMADDDKHHGQKLIRIREIPEVNSVHNNPDVAAPAVSGPEVNNTMKPAGNETKRDKVESVDEIGPVDEGTEPPGDEGTGTTEEERLEDILYERPSPVISFPQQEEATPPAALFPDRDKTPTAQRQGDERASSVVSGRSKKGTSWAGKTVSDEKRSYGRYVATTTILLFLILMYMYNPVDREPDTSGTTSLQNPEVQPLPSAVEDSGANGMDGSTSSGSMEESGLIVIMTERGQTLWDLADEYTGDSYLWPWIYQLNRNSIGNPDVIRAGEDLTLPVPSEKGNPDNTELKQVAEGYVSVYRWYKEQNSENARHFLWAAGLYYPDLLDDVNNNIDQTDIRFARNR